MKKYLILILIILSSFSVSGSYLFDFDNNQDLLMYYDMLDGGLLLQNTTAPNAGILDGNWNFTSVGMSPRHISNTSGFFSNNSFGQLSLDSSEYIEGVSAGLEVNQSINPSTFFQNDSFTYAVWFRKNNASLVQREDVFRFQSNNPQQTLSFETNGSVSIKFRDENDPEEMIYLSGDHFKDYSWHFVCFVGRDQGTSHEYEVYLDNSSYTLKTLNNWNNVIPTTCTPNDANACDIGHTDHSGLDTFNGSITEFRLYNTSLSAEQCGELHDIRLLSNTNADYPYFTRKPTDIHLLNQSETYTINLNYSSDYAVTSSSNDSETTLFDDGAGTLQINFTPSSAGEYINRIEILNGNGSDSLILQYSVDSGTPPPAGNLTVNDSLVFYTNFQDNSSLFANVSVLNLGVGTWDYDAINFIAQDIKEGESFNGLTQALNFSDAKDQHLVANATLNPLTVFTTNELTFSAWVKIDPSDIAGDLEFLFHITDNLPTIALQHQANNSWSLQVRSEVGTERIHFFGDEFATGGWEHIGFEIRNESTGDLTVTLYHNGTVTSNHSQAYNGNLFGNDCDLGDGGCGVGYFASTGAFEYRGQLDELRIYNTSIGSTEMSKLSNLSYFEIPSNASTDPPSWNQSLTNDTYDYGTLISLTLNWTTSTSDAFASTNLSGANITTDNSTKTATFSWFPSDSGTFHFQYNIENGNGSDNRTAFFTINPDTPSWNQSLTNDSFQFGGSINLTLNWSTLLRDSFSLTNLSGATLTTDNTTKTASLTWTPASDGLFYFYYTIENSDGSDNRTGFYNITAVPVVPITNTCSNITDDDARQQCEELAATGAGTGAFFDGLKDPLSNLFFKFVVVFFVIVLFGGIAFIMKDMVKGISPQ